MAIKEKKATPAELLEKQYAIVHEGLGMRIQSLERRYETLNAWNIDHTKNYNKTIKLLGDGLDNIKIAMFSIFCLNLIVSAAITYWMIA